MIIKREEYLVLLPVDEERRRKKNESSDGVRVEDEYETGHSLRHDLFA